jgi:hypothetical protein
MTFPTSRELHLNQILQSNYDETLHVMALHSSPLLVLCLDGGIGHFDDLGGTFCHNNVGGRTERYGPTDTLVSRLYPKTYSYQNA